MNLNFLISLGLISAGLFVMCLGIFHLVTAYPTPYAVPLWKLGAVILMEVLTVLCFIFFVSKVWPQ